MSLEERERQRRIDEIKRKQPEFEENQRKRDEDIKQQMQMHSTYQQSNLNKNQQLHPGMLRLDNLVINGPSSPGT